MVNMQQHATRSMVVLAVALVVAAAAVLRWWWRRCGRRKARSEPFLRAIVPLVGLGLTAAGVGANVTGYDKKLQQKISGGSKYKPTYVGRQQDGYDWSCPAGTVETGNAEDGKACMNSQYHPPVWRWDGKQWAHSCPNGTVETGEGEWEKKCEVGWVHRVQNGDKWVCPDGTSDSGATWETSPWREAQKQCKRNQAYTQRIKKGDAWVCPPGSKDTGKTWGQDHGEKQCKWYGPSLEN